VTTSGPFIRETKDDLGLLPCGPQTTTGIANQTGV
jgi:hypothetical protein